MAARCTFLLVLLVAVAGAPTPSEVDRNSSAFLLLHPPNATVAGTTKHGLRSELEGRLGPGWWQPSHIERVMRGISNEFVQRVFVIRRALNICRLGVCVPKVRELAHSAVLLAVGPHDRTSVSDYWIVEYMGYNDGLDGQVRWRPVKHNGGTVAGDKVKEAGAPEHLTWSKQLLGAAPDWRNGQCWTVSTVVEEMARLMEVEKAGNYNVLKWNCHMAQEQLRRNMNLTVLDPYANSFGTPKPGGPLEDLIQMICRGDVGVR